MNILFINLLLSCATYSTDMNMLKELGDNPYDLNAEIENTVIAPQVVQKVRILDGEGNIVREILKSDFDLNQMSADEHKAISLSSHMFDYLGDSYYLLD